MTDLTTIQTDKLAWDVPRLHHLGTMDDVRGGMDQPPNDGIDQPDFPAS